MMQFGLSIVERLHQFVWGFDPGHAVEKDEKPERKAPAPVSSEVTGAINAGRRLFSAETQSIPAPREPGDKRPACFTADTLPGPWKYHCYENEQAFRAGRLP